jgi:hypothetical protein
MAKKEEGKTSRLCILVAPSTRRTFDELCARMDETASQAVRRLIRFYIAQGGVIPSKPPSNPGQ